MLVAADVVDLLNGQYDVTYTPKEAGIYSLRVLLNPSSVHPDFGPGARDEVEQPYNIVGSPFSLKVHVGATLASTSFAYGGDLESSEAGLPHWFYVQVSAMCACFARHWVTANTVCFLVVRSEMKWATTAPRRMLWLLNCDSELCEGCLRRQNWSNRLLRQGWSQALGVAFTMVRHYAMGSFPRSLSPNNPPLSVSFVPTVAGECEWEITVAGGLTESTTYAHVVHPTKADGPSSTAVGVEDATTAVGVEHHFVVTARDSFSNR